MKVENGPCIGGFTSAQWKSEPDRTEATDPFAFLFSVTEKKWLNCKCKALAIANDENTGPNFGTYELMTEEPFNGPSKCISIKNETVYNIPSDKLGRNILTHSRKDNFTITELEVWEVEFADH